MDRRTALQCLPVVFSVTASPGQLLEIARRVNGTVYFPASTHEHLIVALVDRILPATSTPSASEAGVPAFIRIILADLVSPEDRDKFNTMLDQFSTSCLEAHGKHFQDLSANVQDMHLKGLLQERDEFCMQLKQMTIVAYFTSRQGMTEALDYNPIPGKYDPCVEVTPDTKTEASYF